MNEKASNNDKKQTTANPNNNFADTAPIPCENQQIKSDFSENKRQNTNKNGWPNRVQAILLP